MVLAGEQVRPIMGVCRPISTGSAVRRAFPRGATEPSMSARAGADVGAIA
jgi:hypothetical protein